jgi:hypothetical protein
MVQIQFLVQSHQQVVEEVEDIVGWTRRFWRWRRWRWLVQLKAGGSGNTPPTSPPQGNPGGTADSLQPYPVPVSGGGGGGATAAGNNSSWWRWSWWSRCNNFKYQQLQQLISWRWWWWQELVLVDRRNWCFRGWWRNGNLGNTPNGNSRNSNTGGGGGGGGNPCLVVQLAVQES